MMRDETTPPIICESCGCEVYAAGHPGNMCRMIVALRVERDAIVAELARVGPVVEKALEYEWVPCVNCIHCGKFVGRDGYIHIEHFEMSSEVASVDGECRECLGASRDAMHTLTSTTND